MSFIDRDKIKRRFLAQDANLPWRSMICTAIDAICNEIDLALQRTLDDASAEQLERVGFAFIERAEQRLRDEKAGKKHEPATLPPPPQLIEYGPGMGNIGVEPVRIGWQAEGATVVNVAINSIRAIVFDENMRQRCRRIAEDLGWYELQTRTYEIPPDGLENP